jgi:ubiquinone/menaquinone biosynthesis C-methylase UbiE
MATAGQWLELGCGHQFLPEWLSAQEGLNPGPCRVVGIDLDADALSRHAGLSHRILGNIEALPFRNNTFSLVTANMVIEHVANPATLFAEVSRVLARGGLFLVHTPNLNGYTTVLTRAIPSSLRAPLASVLLGRDERDVYPTFYRANTHKALKELAHRSGLVPLRMEYVESSPQLIAMPPLLLGELALIRALRWRRAAGLRACILAIFAKSEWSF